MKDTSKTVTFRKTMRKILSALALCATSLSCIHANITNLEDVADSVARKSAAYIDIEDYKGSVYLMGLSAMEQVAARPDFADSLNSYLARFADGSLKGYGSFVSYTTGGTAMAQQAFRHCNPAWKEIVALTAERQWEQMHHNSDGMILPKWTEVMQKDAIFVDCAFPVCSYYVYAGLLENKPEYLDCAANMALKMFQRLYDADSGLVHQARAVSRLPEGVLSQDCWSRGNGWLALGLSYLLDYLPAEHPYRAEVERVSKEFFTAVLRYQDSDGLWHQEMTWEDSYQEISGSALLLCGIGSAIGSGVLDRSEARNFEKGLRGLLLYIDDDGNVGNTCSGCLAYLNATKADYASHQCYTNEAHAFGCTLLALAKGIELGYGSLADVQGMGSRLEGRIPRCHVRYIQERKGDMAWENDKLAFRMYSSQVTKKGFSGIDFWTKSVDYPIVDKWYKANAEKEGAYHEDKGEGCDFYAIGANRGVGGSGVVADGELYVADTFTDYRILENIPRRLSFEVTYPPYEAAGDTIFETKRIDMELGNYYFDVCSTLRSESGRDITFAAGVTTFGNGNVRRDAAKGILSVIEEIGPENGTIASAILADPEAVSSFECIGSNQLTCFRIHSGESVTYRVAAGWSKDLRWDPLEGKWPKMLEKMRVQTPALRHGRFHCEGE